MIYNTTPDVRHIATMMLLTIAFMMPFHAYPHAAYFTLRTGGKVFVTLLLDSGYTWVVAIPVAFVLSRFTNISIIPLYAFCQGIDIIKCIFAAILLKKVNWANKLIENK
jgi:Na+-driven multidrug efflux pump